MTKDWMGTFYIVHLIPMRINKGAYKRDYIMDTGKDFQDLGA